MADLKITALPALVEAGIQSTDVLALADLSATETKKVTVKDLVAAAAQFLDAGDIPAAKVGTLGTNQVATGAIVDGAVTNVKLANSSISLGGVSIALGATDATPAFNLADATGYTTANLSGTITNAQLAGSIAGTKLSDTTIAYAKLNLSDGDIPGAKIATGGITATQLAANSVTASELADDAVDTAAIADGAVVAASIATDTITANQIAANAIGASELADNAVDAGAIAADAVTTAKILDANVTAAKLAANLPGTILATGAIGSTQLAANSVTASELADNAVDSGAIAASAVTDAKIASGIGGAKITDGTITAAKLATANIDRSLNVASGNLGINNTVVATTRSGITYNAQGLITGTVDLAAADLPVATTSAVGGVSVGTGLAVTGAGALSLSNSVTAVTGATKVNYDAQGQITGSTTLVAADLPAATTSAKGAVLITSGGGLSVDGSGGLTTSASGVGAGTYQSVVVNTKGVVTSGTTLVEGNIPNLSAAKITSGTFDVGRFGTNTITGVKLADSSVCQFTGAQSTSGVVTFPTAEFKGQFFYDLTNDDLYVYDGSAFQPVTITSGEIIYAGNYRADTNKITSMTAAGTAAGFTLNGPLAAAAAANNRYYFVCDKSGTGTSPAPTVAINPPDMILSNGDSWEKLDISNFIAGQVASNIGVTATGGIQNTNVQSVLEELDNEKLNTTGGTLTGNLALNQSSSIIFEGSTPDDFETTLTVIDPTADRTLSLPNVTGTLVSTGDTGSVTSTMITDGTIVNADINASAAIALTKLANVTAAHIIVGNGSNIPTAVAITGDISISNAGLVSITADSIVNADIKSDAAISGSKIVAGTTSVVGVVQLVDSVSSPSTTLAATGASVKAVNDALTTTTATADAALPKAGGTLTGNLIVDNAKQIRFTETDAEGAHYVSLQAPDALAADVSYTLPSAAPTANGQVLASTTGGVLSWTEDPAGGWVTSGNDISYNDGRVLIGDAASSSVALLTVEGYSGGGTGQGIIYIQRGSVPSQADQLAEIRFADSAETVGAKIVGESTATWGSTNKPGRLKFYTKKTTSDVLALTIDEDQNATFAEKLGVGTAPGDGTYTKLSVAGTGSAGSPSIGNGTVAVFRSTGGAGYAAAVSVIGGTTGSSNLYFGDTDSESGGRLEYSHTNDSMTLRTAEQIALTLDSSQNATFAGNVTTGHHLTISGADPRLQFVDTNNNPDFTIWANAQQFSIYDDTNSASRLFINSSGKIGIGSTSPAAQLHVDYDYTNSEVGLRLRASSGSGTKTWQLSEINGNAGVFTIRNATNSINALNINADGEVGIGTTSPSRLLHVSEASTTAYDSTSGSNNALLRLHNTDGSDNGGVNNHVGIEMYVGSGATSLGLLTFTRTGNNTGDLTYKSRIANGNYAEHFRIQSNGKVGCGTTSPLKKLHIADAGDVGIALQTTNANTDKEMWEITCGSNASSEADLTFQSRTDAGTGGIEALRLSSSGNVGIGTSTPNQKLHVKGLCQFETTNSTNAWVNYAHTDNTYRFNYNGAGNDELILDSGGDVKINDGNLILGTAGHGIMFHPHDETASSPGSDSNLLADYEEGTWTPTNTVGLTLTVMNTTAYYVKVGKLCTVWFDIKFTGYADSAQCSMIQNLPFMSSSETNYYQQGDSVWFSNADDAKRAHDDDNSLFFVDNDSTTMKIWNVTGGHVRVRAWAVVDSSNGRRCRGTITYKTA